MTLALQALPFALLPRVDLTEGLLQSRRVPSGGPAAPRSELPRAQHGLLHGVQQPSGVPQMVTCEPVQKAGRGSRFSVHLLSRASVSREYGAPDHQRSRSA